MDNNTLDLNLRDNPTIKLSLYHNRVEALKHTKISLHPKGTTNLIQLGGKTNKVEVHQTSKTFLHHLDTPSKLKLGGNKLKILQTVQDTNNNKPSPKTNIFRSNNNNPSLFNLICSKDMSNKSNNPTVDINSPHISTSDLVYINHFRSWQL